MRKLFLLLVITMLPALAVAGVTKATARATYRVAKVATSPVRHPVKSLKGIRYVIW